MQKQTVWRCMTLMVVFFTGVQAGWAMVSGNEAEVRRTTVPGVTDYSVGKFEFTQADALIWRSSGRSIVMPYKDLTNVEYSSQLAHHLGFFPSIAVSSVRKRERKHFFTFFWTDEGGLAQVLEVEVAKDAPRGIVDVIRARAPQACSGPRNEGCGAYRFMKSE